MKTNKLSGLKILVTGAFQKEIDGLRVTRSQVFKVIKQNGGIIAKAPAKDVSFLVDCQGNGGSSKTRKCFAMGIPSISERQFWNKVK